MREAANRAIAAERLAAAAEQRAIKPLNSVPSRSKSKQPKMIYQLKNNCLR